MDENVKIRNYKDRLRIFMILYFFSEPYYDKKNPAYKKRFKSEQRIQKIDFLIRNPDYLSLELLKQVRSYPKIKEEIKQVVKDIFDNKEPVFRRLEMERFFFGAYEDIDDVIAFLKSIGFIFFTSKKSVSLKTIEKQYFVSELAINNYKKAIDRLPTLKWYVERCELIHKYFGNLSGNELRLAQYEVDEYKHTSLNDYINPVVSQVKGEYYNIYLEKL